MSAGTKAWGEGREIGGRHIEISKGTAADMKGEHSYLQKKAPCRGQQLNVKKAVKEESVSQKKKWEKPPILSRREFFLRGGVAFRKKGEGTAWRRESVKTERRSCASAYLWRVLGLGKRRCAREESRTRGRFGERRIRPY